jgi:hypothetical protein
VRQFVASLAIALSLSTAGLAGSLLADAPPLCRVSVTLEPRLAWVDQQVFYKLRIETRQDVRSVEWLTPPTLPGLRWERLPGNPDAGRVTRDGVVHHVREEHRALFPERPGEIVLPPASLRCESPDGLEDTPVPGVALRVRALPAAGRPAEFSGLVGSVAITRRLQPRNSALGEPPAGTALEVSAGETLRLSVRLRGSGNLWDAAPPLQPDVELGAAVEIFALEPEQDLERAAALSTRRLFRYDLVPREAGQIRLPEQRLDYFDPESGSYAVAMAPAILVNVAPRSQAAPGHAGPGSLRSEAVEPAPEPDTPTWPSVTAALAVAGLALLVWRRARAGRPRGPEAATHDDAQESAAAAASRRLRYALHGHVEGLQNATPEEILERPELPAGVREAARVLAAVERARYDPQARGPEPREIEQAVSGLGGGQARRGRR